MRAIQEIIEQERIVKYKIAVEEEVVSFERAITLFQESEAFRDIYIDLLQNSDYIGFHWEVKPVTTSKLNEDFEFVLVRNDAMSRLVQDTLTFKKYFNEGELAVTFPNLGGDAQLIVPTNLGGENTYAHLADFVRKAPREQNHEFWKLVGKEYAKLIGAEPKWLSTAGMGVYWLHVRVDSRPKYYRYQAYKRV